MNDHYVYGLLDAEGVPFYVGHGRGYRAIQHFSQAKLGKGFNENKIKKIREIQEATGRNPEVKYFFQGLSKVEAYLQEAKMISDLKAAGVQLTNMTPGGPREYEGQGNPCSSTNMPKEKRLAKAVKTAEVVVRTGILRGSNHPLFGIGHTPEAKLKIQQNHADCSGAKNSHAKSWMLRSPAGEEFVVKGELRKFCQEKRLALGIITRNANKGPILKTCSDSVLAKNSVGWTVRKS